MVFVIQSKEDKFMGGTFKKSIADFNKFFGVDLKEDNINLFLVPDRTTINLLWGVKTENWVVGWVNGTDVFFLDRKNYEKESCHKYSDEDYSLKLRHELVHAFFGILSQDTHKPLWLSEGLSIYLSGQLHSLEKPNRFRKFLGYYDKYGPGIYEESGFAVEFLIKTYGKHKLLELIKSLRKIDSKKEFGSKFKEIYGFDLNYGNFKVL
jgi:hypothetical protein